MASCADEQSYEEMIRVLQDFISKVSDACGDMETAARDCVDNTDGDPAAEKSSAKVQQCVARFRGTLETAQNVITYLEEEIEEIRRRAAQADSID